MAIKRLVVCCDGTWNDSDNGTGYTNVSRLAWAIQPVDKRDGQDIAQIVFYQSGVGTQGDLASKVAGGALGLGLSQNLRDAYTFVCNNYCEGDEIFLFGFSRGAYTARSVAGLIGYAGLLGKQDLDRFLELWKGYKEKDKNPDVLKSFDGRHKNVPIKCIGVWDTVGSVGIPAEFAKFDLFFKKYYGFFDTDLGEHVEHAFHALALDERRKNFVPTLWTQKPGVKNQELKQVWFAGVHCDVGGGYAEHGASDISLAWMASEVAPYLAIDPGYLKLRRDLTGKWALGELHESFKDFWTRLGQERRLPFAKDRVGSCEKLHFSVAARMKGGGLGADGAAYASAPLKGIDLAPYNVDLSPFETDLRWSDADVKAAPPAAKKAFSFRDFFVKAIGGG